MVKNVVWLDDVSMSDVDKVGGKNASLGEMIQHLSGKGVSIPSGFAITAQAYQFHLQENNLEEPIQKLLAGLQKTDLHALAEVGARIRTLIQNAPLPAQLVTEIITAYKALSLRYGTEATDVAVRSSATAEDLPEASFAGQQESYLNIHGQTEFWRL